jgi:cysteate synthase
MAEYELVCPHRDCRKRFSGNEDYRLSCDSEGTHAHGPVLLRAEFAARRIEPRKELHGIFRYADWLPIGNYVLKGQLEDFPLPVVYRSHGLAGRLGLTNLYIAFSGYWPERGALLITRSFKEFEVQISVTRYASVNAERSFQPLVIASAGNTANAYSLYATRLNMPLYIVVPEVGLDKMILPVDTCATVIAVRGEYSDAIRIAHYLEKAGMTSDGGARNVARRAGMGAVMLHAVIDQASGSGRIFDHYFQAIGSGSGAIAAWEAVELLLRDGRFGTTRTRIHMAQNEPYTPIPDAWEEKRADLIPMDSQEVARRIAAATAQVLTTRTPPYSLPGGLYDTLQSSAGATWKVSNYALFQAARSFKETEGIDVGESSAVAVAALEQAVNSAAVKRDDHVLLHITGGGYELRHSAGQTQPVAVRRACPVITINPSEQEMALQQVGMVPLISGGKRWLFEYN